LIEIHFQPKISNYIPTHQVIALSYLPFSSIKTFLSDAPALSFFFNQQITDPTLLLTAVVFGLKSKLLDRSA
jgi:hypothetical protein